MLGAAGSAAASATGAGLRWTWCRGRCSGARFTVQARAGGRATGPWIPPAGAWGSALTGHFNCGRRFLCRRRNGAAAWRPPSCRISSSVVIIPTSTSVLLAVVTQASQFPGRRCDCMPSGGCGLLAGSQSGSSSEAGLGHRTTSCRLGCCAAAGGGNRVQGAAYPWSISRCWWRPAHAGNRWFSAPLYQAMR